jgi:hypothetical protein
MFTMVLKSWYIHWLAMRGLWTRLPWEAKLASQISLPRGCLLLYRNPRVFSPDIPVAVYDGVNKPFLPSENLERFENFLKDAQPSLDDIKLMTRLFELAAPLVRRVQDEAWWASHHPLGSDYWYSPRITEKGLEFFCNEYENGDCEHITVSRDYYVRIERIGPGFQVRGL